MERLFCHIFLQVVRRGVVVSFSCRLGKGVFLSYSLASNCKLIPWCIKEVFFTTLVLLYDHDVDELFCWTATLSLIYTSHCSFLNE